MTRQTIPNGHGPPPAPPAGPPAWAVWTTVTFAAVTYHLLIDMHLGLFGPVSADMSVIKGLWGLARSGLWAWWLLVVALAVQGRPGALRATLILTAVHGVLTDGIIAIAAAPPPSDAFPWQDVAHFAALIAGAVATWLTWHAVRQRGRPEDGRWIVVVTVVLLVASMALSAPLNLEAISSPRG